jgi:hypothetical protein
MDNSEKTSSPERTGDTGLWIFRGLTLVGAAVFLYTWFQPWWVAYIEELQQNGVVIYPYAMNIAGDLLDYPEWIIGYEMPVWFFPAMWVFLAICIFSLVASLFFKNEWFAMGKRRIGLAQFLVGLAGFGYTVFVIVFPIVVALRAPEFGGVQLQGNVFISMDEHTESYVVSTLQAGYWIACFVGPGLLILSALHKKLVGKS